MIGRTLNAMTVRNIVCAVVMAALAGAAVPAQQTAPSPAAGDCVPNRPPAVQARIDAVTGAPAEFLPKLELARCYDLAWRMADVEPAILNAMASLRVAARTTPVPAVPAPSGAVFAGIGVPALVRLNDVAAEYPHKALVDGVTGLVIVEALIDKDGKVKQARASESVRGLDAAAIQAVRKARFAPANQHGQPIEVVTYLPIRFGQTRDLWASDWMHLARFYFRRGLPQLAEAALETARQRAQRDYDRYGEISGVTGTAGKLSTPPTRVSSVAPVYPPEAQKARISGVVSLQVLVDRFGDVGRVVVLKPLPMLDLSAQHAVMQWKYAPAQVGGQPVSASMSTLVTFRAR